MKKVVWQYHHVSYEPEIVVKIRRSVHFICTKIQRHTKGLTNNEKWAIKQAVSQIPTREDPDEK